MAKRPILIWLTAACALGLAYAGYELRKQQDAQALVTRGMHLLHANAASAPELPFVQAVQARMLFREAQRKVSSDELKALQHLASAFVYLQKADLTRAERSLLDARTHLGSTPDVLYLRAAIARQRGDLLGAQRDVQQALGKAPHHTRSRLLYSETLIALGMSVEALNSIDVLVHHEGASASAENLRGVALEALGHTREAKEAFSHAVALDGRLHQPHLNLARRLQAEGRAQDALISFLAAAERAPDDASPRLGAGLCRLLLGDLAGAEADFVLAERHAPEDGSIQVAHGDLAMKQGQYAQAAQRYTRAIALQPDLSLAYLKLGNVQMLMGEAHHAVASYRAAIAKDPSLSAAHNGLGAALMAHQDREGAALALTTAAALDDRDPNPLLNLARLHRDSGDLRSAREALAQAQDRNPLVALAGL